MCGWLYDNGKTGLHDSEVAKFVSLGRKMTVVSAGLGAKCD